MKSNTLNYLLVFALALTFTATGCKHKPTPLTVLPGHKTEVGPEPPAQLPPGERVGTGETAMGGGPLGNTWDPNDPNLVQYRATLAAHTVHFDYDSSTIKQSEESHVEAVATALKTDSAAKLQIEGHCDERGTEEYNRALGERRALALREALVKLGIDADRIQTISYGEDKPVDPGHTEAAWKKNRRGEFVLFHPKQ